MSSEVKILRINAAISSINPLQIAVEPTADSDLGVKMWGGQDDAGTVTKFLGKDKPIRVTSVAINGTDEALPQALVIPAGSDTAALVPVIDDPDIDTGVVDPIVTKAATQAMVDALFIPIMVLNSVADMTTVPGSAGMSANLNIAGLYQPLRCVWDTTLLRWRLAGGQVIGHKARAIEYLTAGAATLRASLIQTIPAGLLCPGDHIEVEVSAFSSSGSSNVSIGLDPYSSAIGITVQPLTSVVSRKKFGASSLVGPGLHCVHSPGVEQDNISAVAISGDGLKYYTVRSGVLIETITSTGAKTTLSSDIASYVGTVKDMQEYGGFLYIAGYSTHPKIVRMNLSTLAISDVMVATAGGTQLRAGCLFVDDTGVYLATAAGATINSISKMVFRSDYDGSAIFGVDPSPSTGTPMSMVRGPDGYFYFSHTSGWMSRCDASWLNHAYAPFGVGGNCTIRKMQNGILYMGTIDSLAQIRVAAYDASFSPLITVPFASTSNPIGTNGTKVLFHSGGSTASPMVICDPSTVDSANPSDGSARGSVAIDVTKELNIHVIINQAVSSSAYCPSVIVSVK